MYETKDAILPTYLLENGIEFFAMNNDGWMLQNDKITDFDNFDPVTYSMVESEYDQDKRGQIGLDRMGMKNYPKHERMRRWVMCMYGAFDTRADFYKKAHTLEYYDCGMRGICPGESYTCKPIHGLTKMQVKVAIKIADGLLDGEIADELHISPHTAKNHRRAIQTVLGLKNKSGIAAFAVSMNLIPNK